MGYRRWAEADRTLRVCASSNPIFGAAGADVYIRLLWAQTLDALGRIDDALDAYRFVDAAWRRADPALRPYHAVAADAVRRLAAEERLPATSRRYTAVP